MFDLWTPFWGHILERGGGHDGEADKEDIRLREDCTKVSSDQLTSYLGVGERPKPVVVLLARRVPQPQGDRHPVTHHRGRVIVKPGKMRDNIFCNLGHFMSQLRKFKPIIMRNNVQGCAQLLYSHSGHIFPREAVRGVGDQHARLAHRPVAHHHTLDRPPARHYG